MAAHEDDNLYWYQRMFDLATLSETLKRRTTQLLTLWAFIFGMGISNWGCVENPSDAAPTFSGPSLVDRIDSAEALQTLLDSPEQPVLVVEFYADWCKPCHEVAPIMEAIAREAPPNVKIVKIDIDKNRSLADRYRVRGIPTVVVIRDQKLVDSLLGVKTKKKYLEMIRKADRG